MDIIIKTPNDSGAYQGAQSWTGLNIPNGYAIIADTLDMTSFYEHNGFVTLTIKSIEYVNQDETYTIDTVIAYEPNIEAWEAWKSTLPKPTEPKPSQLDLIEAQVTYTAMMTDTLLGV